MKYTNKHKVPKYFSDWLKEDDYDYVEGVISATRLLKPTRMILLEERNKDKLEVDVLDRLDIKIGTAIHNSLSRKEKEQDLQEKRVFYTFEEPKVTISGKFDLAVKNKTDYTLVDFKTTKTYKWVVGDFDDYIKQLSIYKFLCEQENMIINDTAEIGFYFKDWDRTKTSWKSYPNIPIMRKKLKLMTTNEIGTFLYKKLFELEEHKNSNEWELPKCSDKELWLDKKGVPRRCDYCLCREFCSQYKERKEVKE